MGEGAGAIILEDYDHAVQRGATILCEVIGGGMSADAATGANDNIMFANT